MGKVIEHDYKPLKVDQTIDNKTKIYRFKNSSGPVYLPNITTFF
ncbi:MAG: hypothetical protein Barrevirus19_11 [Barrevirus sp.]|uniref:Uncharacterized protein n=1 Tax=Barrevirus sp. TaxID=2487763 RepID=A0A3G4ZQP3_9VIRU|nr:MAG: hypothetical protein Barrevirus19_11 [Barrevirus sp.]